MWIFVVCFESHSSYIFGMMYNNSYRPLEPLILQGVHIFKCLDKLSQAYFCSLVERSLNRRNFTKFVHRPSDQVHFRKEAFPAFPDLLWTKSFQTPSPRPSPFGGLPSQWDPVASRSKNIKS